MYLSPNLLPDQTVKIINKWTARYSRRGRYGCSKCSKSSCERQGHACGCTGSHWGFICCVPDWPNLIPHKEQENRGKHVCCFPKCSPKFQAFPWFISFRNWVFLSISLSPSSCAWYLYLTWLQLRLICWWQLEGISWMRLMCSFCPWGFLCPSACLASRLNCWQVPEFSDGPTELSSFEEHVITSQNIQKHTKWVWHFEVIRSGFILCDEKMTVP